MGQIDIHLTEPQSKILMSKKRFKIVNAGRRFGKSYLAGYAMLIKAINKPNSTIWYVAPTYGEARDIMWTGWCEKNVPKEYIAKKNQQLMSITFKTGSIFSIKSADNPESLRGSGLDLLIIDEAAMITNEDFWETVTPCLSDKYVDGEAMIISTPKGYNWFYDLYQEAILPENRDEWDRFQFTTIEGGNVTPEEVEKRKRSMSKKMFEQEYLASFETMSNRIYYNFDRNLNCVEEEECEDWFGKGGDIHVGIDFNVNPMTATIFAECKGANGKPVAICFDEIVEPNSDTQHLCDSLKRKYPHCDIYAYPDPTCRKRQTNATAGRTDKDIIENNGIHVRVPHAPYASKDKWNTVNTALENAAGERSIFVVRDKCPNLVKAWEGYTYDKNGNPDKSSGLDHVSDAAAYYINFQFPSKSKAIRKPKLLGV